MDNASTSPDDPCAGPQPGPRDGATGGAFPPLPAELTIYTAADTHRQWLAWWHEHGRHAPEIVEVDAAATDSVDAAGLQLLVSLQRLLQRENVTLHLDRASEVLHAACTTLGAAALLPAPGGAQCRRELA